MLLILAGVSINAVIGENGIANKAKESKTATIVAEEEELVNLAYSGAYADNEGEAVTLDDLKESLEGLKADAEVEDNGDGTLKVIFSETGNEYTIETNSKIDWDTIVANIPTKYDEYLEKAGEKGQEASEVNIGIGTDGEVVNLSLWNYFKTDDGKGMSLGKGESSEGYRGYDEENLTADGKIQGKMPQYIYIKAEDRVYDVTMLMHTFNENPGDFSKIAEIPEIPSTVTSISCWTFYGCSNLTNVTIPNSVTNIDHNAFAGCTGLKSITIPKGVISIGYDAFWGCTSLTSVTIPSSVTSIGNGAFYNVPHILYSGTATGSPWDAKSIN